jgi:hypothetical protein
MIDADKTLLARVLEFNNGRTHWEGCGSEHLVCALAARLEETLKDVERIEWLESQSPEDVQGGDELKWCVYDAEGFAIEHDDLRRAIDAARGASDE